MLKPRCIYCGKIFADKEKYETITKPVATTGANGGSKVRHGRCSSFTPTLR